MKHNLYAIYDQVSNTYGKIWSFTADQLAVRYFTQVLMTQDDGSLMPEYTMPNDFQLICVAQYDDQTAQVTIPDGGQREVATFKQIKDYAISRQLEHNRVIDNSKNDAEMRSKVKCVQ